MPKFTIITACYNAEKFISKAIETIRAQTFTDWEYNVIDDGSTDNSAEIISSYKKLEPRLKLIKQSNSGMCIARNNGFKASYQESQYLLFFDADDCLEPQMLEVMINYLNAHPDIGAAYCDFYNIDADDKPINPAEPVTKTIVMIIIPYFPTTLWFFFSISRPIFSDYNKMLSNLTFIFYK